MPYDRATGWLSSFKGVVTAMVTPFDDNGRIDDSAIERLVDLQVAAGVGALMIGGTTGEYVAMEDEERRHALDRFIRCVDGRLPVVANTGHVDLRRARGLTGHAIESGVDAVTAITPYFFPTTVEASLLYFRELARVAEDTGFLVYNFPRNATNQFPAEAFAQLLDEPNVAGAKCSVGSMEELNPYLRFEPECTIFSGNDGIMAEFVGKGGRAIVSGNAAAYPELVTRSFNRLLEGQWGREDAALMAGMTRASWHGAPDRLKVLLRSRGVDAGVGRVRTHAGAEATAEGSDNAREVLERELPRVRTP